MHLRQESSSTRSLPLPDRPRNPAGHVSATDRTSGQYTDQAAITILDVSGANHNKDTPRNATARSGFPHAERAFFCLTPEQQRQPAITRIIPKPRRQPTVCNVHIRLFALI